MREDPSIFIPDEGQFTLKKVLIEKYENFDIYWYHWPHDGPKWFYSIFREEDYEPVILVYCDDDLKCVITRAHWEYQYSDLVDSGLSIPAEIVFEDEWHPPQARTNQNIREFELKKLELIPTQYSPEKISKNEILDKFRTGRGHNTNIQNKVMDDPYQVAQEAYEYYCR